MIVWVGLFSVLLAIVSYSLYFKDIFTGHTKPHSVTWLIWSFLNGFIFMQQIANGGGPGAWVTGVAAIASICIFILSLKHGERHISRLDWVCLVLTGAIIVLWAQQVSDVITVILACIVFLIGFLPTFRKSYNNPYQETILTFGLNSMKFFIALFALQSFTLVTSLYPLFLGLLNGCFVIYLIYRRSVTNEHKKAELNL